ncbi:MAG TPA: hypothetical protein VKL40_15640 [Candidatus Angelobacter sp.]|nr:hypothetical protein [Candidatus Angelobacter sp.]
MKKCSLRALLGLASGLVALLAMTPVVAAASADQTPRAIGSITIVELQSLPDSTTVKLDSGRVVSLGTLRAEHRARMERFSRATALGQATAAKLAAHPANVAPAGGPTTATAPPTPGQNVKASPAKPVRANTVVTPKLDVLSNTFVRFKMPSYMGLPVPKDYADFCKAANPTVCIYFPASTILTLVGTTGPTTFARDEDYLITDMAICKYDGGLFAASGGTFGRPYCEFYYPSDNTALFMPTGPISTSEACDPPAKYVLDPKGAVKVVYPFPAFSLTTGGTPVGCVVQVWVGK